MSCFTILIKKTHKFACYTENVIFTELEWYTHAHTNAHTGPTLHTTFEGKVIRGVIPLSYLDKKVLKNTERP